MDFLYRWVWVNEWHQPLVDYDNTPHEYIVDAMRARKWTEEKNKRDKRKGSRSQMAEDDVRRRSGNL